MIQEVEVPEDNDLWNYFTDKDKTAGYVQCFSSKATPVYDVDEEGNEVLVDGSPVDSRTDQEKARAFITGQLDRIYIKWQRKQAANSATIVSGGIS